MKNRIYLLFSLITLVSVATVSSATAQRRFGGGHVSVGVNVMAGPRIYGGGYYHYAPRPVYRHYYHPYYRYYGPPIGFRVSVLPYGFLTFNTAWGPYYYYDGFFYQSYGAPSSTTEEQYQVVDPPMGVVIPNLPKGAKRIEIDGNVYYEKNGTIYQQVMKDNEPKYVVVGKNGQLDTDDNNQDENVVPSEGNIMATLPDGCRGVEINGQQLYVSPDGMYYQEVLNSDNSRGYKVVGKMSADN